MGAEIVEHEGEYSYFGLSGRGLTVPLQLTTKSSTREHNAETFAKYKIPYDLLKIYKPGIDNGMLYSCIICSVLRHAGDAIDLVEAPEKLREVLAKRR